MDYRLYNVEDFLFDESFRLWTGGTSPEATAFWEQWLAQNPDRAEVVRQAQELVLALNDHYHDDATEDRINAELDRLMQQAASHRNHNDTFIHSPTLSGQIWRWAVAASILIMLGLGSWRYLHKTDPMAAAPYAHLTKQAGIPLLEQVNSSTHITRILLADGSLVALRPGSRLSYPPKFAGTHRTVYLNGEAFFEVTRNPAKPFLIYANQTVTKVLGTSFLVRAFEQEKNVVVTVRTGRVSVYKQQDFDKAQVKGLRQIQGVILTPNQQMTFNLAENHLVKALVANPKAIMPEAVSHEQVFEDAPVPKVLATIEKTYGVKILFNEDELSKCLVNVTFSNESLLEQVDVICQTIGASYEVLDGQIVINGKGCQ